MWTQRWIRTEISLGGLSGFRGGGSKVDPSSSARDLSATTELDPRTIEAAGAACQRTTVIFTKQDQRIRFVIRTEDPYKKG